ncbi:hypothetical protein HG264_09330 [Pseudomonas sp. gcc21]|uniref:hypothetical protein n=1 Tax=Pseudomonas sp. gcc21 TaxID=2726989 RepID=UPI0014514505|nr:hypothetical protein [Pseudomonas sp. gcc21]QJD59098.1 hypothetical protein HG264_09330 [Pseudomonas sp. gcc21]
MQHLSRIICLAAASTCIQFAPVYADSRFQTYASIDSKTYSEIAPIKQMVDGLEGKPIDSGDFAFTHNQLEVGQIWNGFELAFFWRYDYYLQFDENTADILYQDANDLPVKKGRRYDVHLRANHLRSSGVGIGYRYEFSPSLSARVRLNYLTASEMQDGVLSGYVDTQAGGYSGKLDLDYGYSEDLLLDRPTESVKGRGFAADFDIDWHITEHLSTYIRGRDVYSRIRWKNLTYTEASAATDRASYRPDGSLTFRPAVKGINGYRNHTQELPSRYTLGALYRLNPNWSLESAVFAYDDHLFPSVAVNWHLRHATVQYSYDFQSESAGVGLKSRYFEFMLASDDTDWEKAKALVLQLTARLEY